MANKNEKVLHPAQQFIYESAAKDFRTWFIKAADIATIARDHWATRLEKPKVNMSIRQFTCGILEARKRICFALLGMAFENMFKGIFVFRNADCSKGGRLSMAFPSTHKLTALADKIEFQLNWNERLLLERLSVYVIWFAKYPVPKMAKDFEWVELVDSDFDLAEKVFARLHAAAVKECYKTAKSVP